MFANFIKPFVYTQAMSFNLQYQFFLQIGKKAFIAGVADD